VPFIIGPQGTELVGFSTRFPGGFGERMALAEAFLLEVPNGLPSEYAAMVEPMSVGAHAANIADLTGRPVALVIGCGPVGLAVIAALKLRGVGPVVASDYSPERRRLAAIMGADIVVDPAETSPHAHWGEFDVPSTLADLGAAQIAGRDLRRPVIFDCVGAPGLIQAILEKCPPMAHLVIVGVCMDEDRFMPALATNKQMRIDFVFAYTPPEFSTMLFDIAEGRVDVAPMFSGIVGRAGVAAAFQALAKPNDKVKIIVDPGLP
jgi:threonine dehydrogenase-like Zn-dependent dehydrogenase